MQLIADRVGIDGPHGPLVPQTSLTVSTGELVIVKGEPGTGISAFGLALAGRLRPSTGTVTVREDTDDTVREHTDEPRTDTSPAGEDGDIGEDSGSQDDEPDGDPANRDDADGNGGGADAATTDAADTDPASADPTDAAPDGDSSDGRRNNSNGGDHDTPKADRGGRAGRSAGGPTTAPAAIAARVAVVDAPGVSEPDDALPLHVVVGEELALAGRPANRAAVGRWLTEHDAAPYADSRFEHLDADLRTRLLTTLAASRDGVRMLVLDRPDRHTSETDSWLRIARDHAERGLAVVVLTATAADSALPADPVRIGRVGRPDPARPLPEAHS